MLDFIYYPISGILWVWHWVFSKALVVGDSPGRSGIAWALAVVFLVLTLRAILYKPFVKQVRTQRQMQAIAPQMQAVKKKYGNDRVRMSQEMQNLQKEHGFNPLLGCLPIFLQIPVFIGLFHVLRSFNRMGTGFGQLGMSVEQTRNTGNYFFDVAHVQSFLDARLFGVPLSSYIAEPKTEWAAFMSHIDDPVDFSRVGIAIVAVPLMIFSSIATHLNSRASVSRQTPEQSEQQQTRIMNLLALYIFPLGILVSGAFFPVAILLYWVFQNLWTYGQQHIVFGQMDKEEAKRKEEQIAKRAASGPKPGQRPKRKRTAPAADSAAASAAESVKPEGTKPEGAKPDLTKRTGDAAASGSSSDAGGAAGSADAGAAGSANEPPRPRKKKARSQRKPGGPGNRPPGNRRK